MVTEKIMETLQLKSEFGWNLVDLKKWNNDSFYSYMIENDSFCLGWIALVKIINVKNIQKHHFNRNEPKHESNDFIPKVLIVTNGRRWFLSNLNSSEYTEVKKEAVLMAIYENLKMFTEQKSESKDREKVERGVKKSMEALKKSIAGIGNAHTEKRQIMQNLFSGREEWIAEDSYKAMYDVMKMRAEVIETILNMRNEEVNDMKVVMHQQLITNYSSVSLQCLLKHVERTQMFVYLCMGIENENLILKLFSSEIYAKHFNKDLLFGKYFMITPDGEIKEFFIENPSGKQKAKPSLFRLDVNLLKSLLTESR